MEDYNTATMPHEKYYQYEVWEVKDYQQRQQQQRLLQQTDDKHVGLSAFTNDEEACRRERKQMKLQQEQQALAEVHSRLLQDKHLQADMKKQQQLQTQLQLAHKQGDTALVKRLERLLAPAEEKPTVKHPWS